MRRPPLYSCGVFVALFACSGSDSPRDPLGPPAPIPASITLSATELTFAALLTTQQLTAVVKDQAGAVMSGAEVVWASSNQAVATVSPSGLVTSLGNGTASVSAGSGGASSSAVVVVQQVPATLTLSRDSLRFASLGDTVRLAATPRDENGQAVAGMGATWSSSNTNVASLSPTGLVTSVGNGEALVTATVGGIAKSAIINVEQLVVEVRLQLDSVHFRSYGDSAILSVVGKDGNGHPLPTIAVSWSSSDSLVAIVSNVGVVSAVGNGAATISATSGLARADAHAIVQQIAASVVLSPDSLVLASPGDTARINSAILDAGGSSLEHPKPAWTSSDTSTATVDGSGKVTALASGSSRISVQVDMVKADVLVRVRGSHLKVNVTGDGQALSDVAVWLTMPTGATQKGVTDDRGIALFRSLSPGAHTLTLQQLPVGFVGTTERTVEVEADRGHEVTFSGTFAPAQLVGTARAWGRPVAGATIEILGKDSVVVVVDTAGAFQVDSLRRGQYTLAIRNHEGYRFLRSEVSVVLESGSNRVDFRGKPDPEPAFTSVDVGGAHACAVTTTGDAYCWGLNGHGQLGDGTTTTREDPTLVGGGRQWAAISAGTSHTCGLTTNGSAFCWGFNALGRLGEGTLTSRSTPVQVVGGLSWAAISAGAVHTCGLATDGSAFCWGGNAAGVLGDGTQVNRSTPAAVGRGLSWTVLSSGDNRTCGVTGDQGAYCWGVGQLGGGSSTTSLLPVEVAGGHAWATLSTGELHSCGVTAFGETYCWGGLSGDGTETVRLIPTLVSPGVTWSMVSSGAGHTCGLTSDGSAYCWGYNGNGQLGDGTKEKRLVPAAVSGGLTWRALSSGSTSTCGLTVTGRLYCWGTVPERVGGSW